MLIAAGVSLVCIIAMLLYSVSRRFLPVWLSFACVFAFLLQAFHLNLFNYIVPYSYPTVYGSMFSVLLLWLILRAGSEFTWRHVVVPGFVAGLMTLTKLEFGVVGYGGIACALLTQSIRKKSLRDLGPGVCACIPGAIPWLAVYGWYVHVAGVNFLFAENLSILPSSYFMQHFGKLWNQITGLVLTPRALAKSAAIGLAGFGTLAASIVLAAKSRRLRWMLPAIGVGICGMHMAAKVALRLFHRDVPSPVFEVVPFLFFSSGMIWICVVVLAMAARDWWRGIRPVHQQSTIVLCATAIGCGIRILTGIQPFGYSIFYDALVYLVWLVGLYRISAQFSVDLNGLPGKVLTGVLCVSMVALTFSHYPVYLRSYRVSSERGALVAAPSAGKAFSQVLAFIENAKRSSQRVVVMPEDTALYYFSGTVAPSRWYMVTGQVLPPGDPTARYIDELERANIRYVVLSNRSCAAFEIPLFGVDYGWQIRAWLDANYRVVRQIGNYEAVADPKEWGVLIYERKTIGASL